MKVTKKQIDAALALADGTETDEQLALCEAASNDDVIPAYDGCINILAAAYRQLLNNKYMNKQDTILCFDCDGRLHVVPQTIIEKIDGVEYTINDVPIHKCNECGQESFSAAALRMIEAALPERPRRGPRRLKDN